MPQAQCSSRHRAAWTAPKSAASFRLSGGGLSTTRTADSRGTCAGSPGHRSRFRERRLVSQLQVTCLAPRFPAAAASVAH